MNRVGQFAAGLALALGLVAPAAAEPFRAPLPPGYQPSGQPGVTGLYAEVIGLSSLSDEPQLEELGGACQARGKAVMIVGEENRFKGAARIYRSADAVAVIVDSPDLTFDTATCTARFTIRHSTTVRTGPWDFDEVPYFMNPVFNCQRPYLGNRCTERTFAGIAATCLDTGDGFVGQVFCVSRRKDLTRGLLLASESYVDEGSVPTGGWALEKVETDALIDPVVFANPEKRNP